MFDRQRNSWKVFGKALSQHYRNTRVWQDFPGRTDRGLRLLPTHYGEVGVGKSDRSLYERRSWQGERQRRRRLSLQTLVLVLIALAACGPSHDPQREFEHVQQLFLLGD